MNMPLQSQSASRLHRIQEEQPQLFSVLGQMHDGVLVCDADSRIIWFNDSLRKNLSLSDMTVGKPAEEAIRSELFAIQIQQVLETCRNTEGEITLFPENLKKIFQIHMVPLLDDQDETLDQTKQALSGVVAIFYDLTAARKIEKMRRDFVANVSHELRTPLTAIKGYAETLLDGAIQDEAVARNFMSIIHKHANRLSALVADLLDLSKLESPDFEPELMPADLRPIAARAIGMVQGAAEEKNITVVLNQMVDGNRVMANASSIEQVFTNLLDNAVKYTPRDGSVTVTLHEKDSGTIQVDIADTGIGIDPKHIPRLFERFYRVDKARSRDMGGTGLGLSIVKHIVQYHGGDIWVDSVAGQGTTFRFTLKKA